MDEIGTYVDVTRLIVGVLILGIASYTDIKTRRASNMLWVIMGVIGGVLLVVQYFTVGFENLYYLIFIPVMIGLMYVLFQLRLIFGGADAKALMAIAILVPFKPMIESLPSLSEEYMISMPGSWIVFTNSVIIFIVIPISLLVYNMAKRDVEFPYCFLGYKMSIEKAREKFVWPLEAIVDGKRRFVKVPKDFDMTEELDEFEKHNINEIWVTPKIPFMIPLLFGIVCTFILGDLLSHLMYMLI